MEVKPAALAQFIGHPADHYDDYQSLLRRLFSPVAAALAHDALHVDAGLALSRLNEAGWKSWDEQERAAVAQFLRHFLIDMLKQAPQPRGSGGMTAEEVLSGVCTATGSTQEWLDVWDGVETLWRPST
jgi:hypothetical protein